ncbi:MAG: FadR/GntR family transcriptional regulator [Smithellaceae bacterium]|jgi:GntR family transcriptional repressor for pyruvate dehydrogenase complex|nr:FadR/GntR family transcriptional regulator [Smithellaceae bacterium]MDD3258730.1 FadR/GntR family transcriptional regulator [Smithellaceae bacterium]MDD3849805.1 FadR/GntR family transcriptional regulator [Smithellaceae bacterium]HOG11469.1 FadR/GntR family transcriptional regulator [Smithellaceae bacterium]HOQ71125.1 FadR/GntR family transcriptional regulator [Smithellaceae bacterium]
MTAKKVLAQPVSRARLNEEIVTVLQNQILSGKLAPGDKIPPERELAETFQVNRATLREALRKLEILELVEIRHGNGLYVKNYLDSGNLDLIRAAANLDGREEVVLDILEARRYLMPQIAWLAAARRSNEDLLELERVTGSEELTMLERDIKVHQIIARSTHNLLCTIGLNFFNQIFRDYGPLYFNDEKNAQRSRKFHRDIYEAIKSQKPIEARKIMREIMIYAEEVVKAGLSGNKKQKES